jgi:hypothetical protein
MENEQTIILLYLLFIWLVVLHTFEEIAQGIFELRTERIKLTKKKYLLVSSLITTLNLSTLACLVSGYQIGLYLAILMTSIFGILQFVVHAFGFIKEGGKARNIGAGFYSSIPLSMVAATLLYFLVLELQ